MTSSEIIKVSALGKETIFIGHNLIPFIIPDLLKSTENIQNYAVITDSQVAKLYLDPFVREWNDYTNSNSNMPLKLLTFVIDPPGEKSKSYSQKNLIEEYLFSEGCGRDTCLIALGGGVIGDLVGFVASTFMRGVPLVQIPTTLLAMVDSSIGGKNGINNSAGKNLIGTIQQPLKVYVNTSFLATLPLREISNGMAEIIKAAVVGNNTEFRRLESSSQALWTELTSTSIDGTALVETMVSAIKAKTDIVTLDVNENGIRELLNFGHTIGHGIEAILAPKLLHGECVSIGMCEETEIAVNLGKCSYSVLERLRNLLELYKLPTSLKDTSLSAILSKKETQLPLDKFMAHLAADKKGRKGQKKIVLLSGIGSTFELQATPVTDEDILRVVAPCIQIQRTSMTNPNEVSLAVPGSKSISNRALLLAAMAEGSCSLEGLLHSEDTKWMTTALKLITNRDFTFLQEGNVLNVRGPSRAVIFSAQPHEIYLGNCGTAARFLTSMAVLAARESGVPIILTGNKRMKERPIGPLVDALISNGAEINYLETPGCLPIKILPAITGFSGGDIKISAKLSSQYVSSILMAAPWSRKEVTLEMVGDHVSSQRYIDITLAIMASFGVSVERVSDRIYLIPVQTYTNPEHYLVEGDASSATYPLAIAAITGSKYTVTNLGSRSLQGDAQFPKLVLERMGCTVEQSDTVTIVQGPPLGTLKPISSIDMDSMTDAFLTASALAATAINVPSGEEPITTIVGVSNGRVKECDRIAVAVEQLKRFGVDAWEIGDGLQIRGKPLEQLKPIDVDCYDDHRVAMSFSVLGTAVPGTTLLDKHCVIKSWPGWWSALFHDLKVPTFGVGLQPHKTNLEHKTPVRKDSSVVLVGMKKAGKTTLGKFTAKKMGIRFIDLDEEFVAEQNMSVAQFIEKFSWELFRKVETELLARVLEENPSDAIIATGGGVVEIKENQDLLKKWMGNGGIVVHMDSDWENMNKEFEEDVANFIPYANSESFLQVARRRVPLYQQFSNYQFYRISGYCVGEASRDLERLVRFVRGELESPLPSKSLFRSFFLCLAVPDISTIQNKLPAMMNGFHAVEVRIDHLKQGTTPDSFKSDPQSLQNFQRYVAQQLAIVRRQVGDTPIIYTIRTVSEGGEFPDDLPPAILQSLYGLGIRLGCEIIDVQCSTYDAFAPLDKGHAKVIASYHQISSPLAWGESAVKILLEECAEFGDVIKLVGQGGDAQHSRSYEDFLNNYSSGSNEKIPLIAINMGTCGQPSRLRNPYMTPATHSSLPNGSAPGQLTLPQIFQGLTILGQVPPKSYYIFGHQISYSKSPLIHNTVFQSLGLPHTYNLFDTDDLTRIMEVLKSGSFHGASVTIPHKEKLLPLMDTLSESATIIGAINTIVKDENSGLLHGDNTDWIGIYTNILKALDKFDTPESKFGPGLQGTVGLVLGAGGTSRAALYALHKLGLKEIYLYNRTVSRANALILDLAKSGLRILGVQDLNKFQEQGLKISIVVDTCPSTAQICTPTFVEKIFAGRNHEGIVVKLAYNVPGQEKSLIITVNGIDILIDQAIEQSLLWTGLKPSRQIISNAMGVLLCN